MPSEKTTIVWFDRDLRLSDNPALTNACQCGNAIVPIYINAPCSDGWPRSGQQTWWLRRSLETLGQRLRKRGSRLVLRDGHAADVLLDIAQEVDAVRVVWNRRYRPSLARRDIEAAHRLQDAGIEVETSAGRLLHDPEEIRTTTGGPYHVYTPFWRKFCDQVQVDPPLDSAPINERSAPSRWPASEELASLFENNDEGYQNLSEYWSPGEKSAHRRLDAFIDKSLSRYADLRDRPDIDGTSRLSPFLHFGEITPRQIWHAIDGSSAADEAAEQAEIFRKQIVWREFSYHLLHHYPETAEQPLRDKFRQFEWRSDREALERWQQGRTGFPIVDAGMRQLLQMGWMHNRVRMIVASFLTKDLLIPWQEGARWFWEHLVDADLANNTMGWQWSAGCGADAQPFFRVFNPLTQSKKFDPDGAYIRRFIPEIAELDDSIIHAPWKSSDAPLLQAAVELNGDYPSPIVDHAAARKTALEHYEKIK